MNYLLSFMKFLLFIYGAAYVGFHAWVFLSAESVRYVIFQNSVKFPFRDFKNPPKYGLNNVFNFYIDTEPNVNVGIWHFIPSTLEFSFEKDGQNTLKEHFEKYFGEYDNRPVLIYVHGNDRDRSGSARVKLCQSLCELGYHVFAIDVRGYGDSTGIPSEQGAVSDVLTLYNFIKRYQREAKIFIWGHSLGTGITSHSAKILSDFNAPPAGIILEAPFYNISQATRDYVVSPMFINNDWIRKKIDEHFDTLRLHFNNAENLLKTKSKIMILHAEDDWLIPQDHSRELIKLLNEKRDKSYPEARLVEFHKGLSLGHNAIYTHKELYPIIREFIETKKQ